ncbi:hypothetical protein BO79DRAFT_254655 [Aspergillus costaricaensis CBS 115574]|uniref:Uncharacterized protein n=1 Tax=Aspergillus costaricaensis CBS 115574 TaxID=1448317 RepID=A0ACD1IGV7_9EURO|nr:hypothetical protein BO79DRAFT_254655 [Aspergillus costaricaensis CBS 115574]RAK89263.1 hypothetical protein BO79DRAFT_254655 [Aspergillus costaricaensis CBS 115574]
MITDALMYMNRVMSTDHRKPSIYVASIAKRSDGLVGTCSGSSARNVFTKRLQEQIIRTDFRHIRTVPQLLVLSSVQSIINKDLLIHSSPEACIELDPDPDLDPSQEHVGLRAMGIGAEDAGRRN